MGIQTGTFYQDHSALFNRLGIKATEKENYVICEFNEDQIKAYQLLHIFLHELGHHYDRIKTKTKSSCPQGENFAEAFAFEHEQKMWNIYEDAFNVVF